MMNYYRAVPFSLRRAFPCSSPSAVFAFKEDPIPCLVKCPALMLWGTADVYLHVAFADILTETHQHLVPNLKLVKLEGASHWVPMERATDVFENITSFLDTELERKED